MSERRILTKYLLPVMLQMIMVVLITFVFRKKGIIISYESLIGVALIILSGMSSALWGVIYQHRYNNKSFLNIIKDFINIRQSIMSYLLVIMFLSVVFGGAVISKGLQVKSIWILVLLFLKALVFGGIEEIGWRYTFQPIMEQMVTYIPAVFITFICWGTWHFLFFYIDGSLASINALLFFLGLLTNCFILSALYAYSGSLWICVMTHALINALSQTTVDNSIVIGVISKIVCMAIAIGLYHIASRKKVQHEKAEVETVCP